MDSGSPRARTVWRGIALLFAVSVVMVRFGVAGCSPAFFGPTKAGGGFNGQAAPAASTAAPAANKPAPATTPTAKELNEANNPPAPDPRLSDPAFFPPTKAGGGFYTRPRPAAAPPQQVPPAAAPPKPSNHPAGGEEPPVEPR